MRLVELEPIHQAQRVVRHVIQRVGRAHRQLEGGRDRGAHQAWLAGVRDLARQAHVAVVVANDVMTGIRQCLAEFLRPQQQLRTETHDQQDRRMRGVTEGFVFEVYAVGVDLGHADSLDLREPAVKVVIVG